MADNAVLDTLTKKTSSRIIFVGCDWGVRSCNHISPEAGDPILARPFILVSLRESATVNDTPPITAGYQKNITSISFL
jgi:hypothetical protein